MCYMGMAFYRNSYLIHGTKEKAEITVFSYSMLRQLTNGQTLVRQAVLLLSVCQTS